MNKFMTFLTALGLGAGAMYYMDPNFGRRRRALVRDRFSRTMNKSDEALQKAERDLRNRVRGTLAEAMARVSNEGATDWVIEERVRATIGRVCSHPGAIDVSAQGGLITLAGPILAEEMDRVIAAVTKVRDVREVENKLHAHETAADMPALQGSGKDREPRFELMQDNWSPSARLLTGVGGSLMALYGTRRKGLVGTTVGLTGLALATRGITNMELSKIVGFGSGRHGVAIQKAINIDASPKKLYKFWLKFENFPQFMRHIQEVIDLGEGRSHWIYKGLAGKTIEWDAEFTEQVENQKIAWRTLPDQAVEHEGSVRFDPNPDGTTRVTVRMLYSPPAGAVGHTVASLLGMDPKHAMDEDLVRLKSLMEEGKTSVEGATVTRKQLGGTPGPAPTAGD